MGCASTVKNYTPESEIEPESQGESRLWYQAEKADKALRHSGQVVNHDNATAYMQSIMDSLFPDYKGHLRVHILRKPILNAFALPNGSIYINTGILSVLENEAQLATVLAHEGVHFLNKHSAKQREYNIQAAGWATVVAMIGVPLLGELTFYSAISGHSRSHESEADNEGYRRLKDAGYEVGEALKPFEQMLVVVEAEDVERPFFFSSHPKLEERIKNFSSMNNSQDSTSGKTEQGRYLSVLGDVRVNALTDKLEHGDYKSLIALLEQETLRETYGDYAYYFLGEAYRLRNQEGDFDNAISSYEKIVDGDQFPEVSYSLGVLYLKRGELEEALNQFHRYLSVGTDSTKVEFSKHYLKQIDKKQKGN